MPDSPPHVTKSLFQSKLEDLINFESMENGSNTPDLILARYLVSCLKTFDTATRARDNWYNEGKGIEENPRKGR